MTAMTRDRMAVTRARRTPTTTTGMIFALASAACFRLSGSLARGLLDAGWSPAAAVLARITVAALVLLPPAIVSLRGRWFTLRQDALVILGYGIFAVAGCQVAFFSAVQHLPVAVALLVEYLAPVAVIGWLWVRHSQRPTRATLGGGAIAAVGLALLLGVFTGAALNIPGLTWALIAMSGAVVYFILSARESHLPPIALAAGGLTAGAVLLAIAGLTGLMPMRATTTAVAYAFTSVPWWLPLLALGIITAAIAYVTGIEASRRLGSRLASFVALLEVVFSVAFALVLLREIPGLWQLAGGVLILLGVLVVKFGERDPEVAGAVSLPDAPA